MQNKSAVSRHSDAGPDGRFSAVYRVLSEGIASHAFPGCAFGVLAGGDVVMQDALGHFTYEEGAPAVLPETVFDVASITKVVSTTSVAMLLYQRGLLDLETPLGDLLPGFVVGRPPGGHAHEVTLRHLLAHNSGLPGYVDFFRKAATPAALFRACLELPLEADPGNQSRVLRSGLHPSRQGAQGLHTRTSRLLGPPRSLRAARDGFHRILSASGSASP